MNTKIMTLSFVSALASALTSSAATTYKSAASGDWNLPSTWGGTVPVASGDETVEVSGHSVTNSADALTVYTLKVGARTTGSDAQVVKRGGSFTSSYLTEIGSAPSRTAPSVLEIEDATAKFEKYRLVIGRDGGNATLRLKDCVLETKAELLMGINTAKGAAPNRMELYRSVWTNQVPFRIGYQSLGTNIVRLVDSSFHAGSLSIGGVGNDGTAIGDNFLVAESSEVEAGEIRVPNGVTYRGHVVVSNSTMKVSQMLLGYVANTTNTLTFIGSPRLQSSSYSYMGYKPETKTVIRIHDQSGADGKASADEQLKSLIFRSVEGERRAFEVEIAGGVWKSSERFIVSQAHNDRTFAFRDMTLPMNRLDVATHAGAPSCLILSNSVWKVPGPLVIADGYGMAGSCRIFDSDCICSMLSVADESGISPHDEQNISGELLLSGGTMVCSGDIYVRRGSGRIIVERGAKVTCGRLFLPNHAGAQATLAIDGGSVLTVTNWLVIGNQSGISCEVAVRDGGQLIVSEDCEKPTAFGLAPNAFSFTVSGEGSLVSIPFETAFATESGTLGTLNLDGGVFETNGFGSPKDGAGQTINFNGGTVRALLSGTITGANSLNYVDVGGAVFDTGKADGDVIIGSVLSHKGDEDVRDGGLVKKGTGRLLLSMENTFNGPVSVENGVLVMACREVAAIQSGTRISLDVANGAYLDRLDESCRYPDGMVISIVDDGRLIPGKRYVIAANWDSSGNVTVNLPDGWISRTSGTDLVARRVYGSVVGIR